MPRFDLKTLPRIPLILIGAVLGLGALLGVLYVIPSGPVHALDRVPDALARLTPAQSPQPAPAVTISDGSGKRHKLGEFRGRYVLVNLWARWCTPCVRELPALARLKAAMPPGHLTVLAVNVGHADAVQTLAFLKAHEAVGLGVWLDSDVALMRAFDVYGLPTTVLIDPQGHVVARAVGPAHWDAPAARAYFQSLPLPKQKTGAAGKPAS